MLPDLGPDKGVDLVVPRGEVEERRVDGEVGVERVDERAEAGPRERRERLYRVVQLNFTPEIEVVFMLFERSFYS